MNPLRTTNSTPNFHRFVHQEIVKHLAAYVYTVGSGRLLKFRSSMTLFAEAASEEKAFRLALERFFDGAADEKTLGLLYS